MQVFFARLKPATGPTVMNIKNSVNQKFLVYYLTH
jgi:hypothetical protein